MHGSYFDDARGHDVAYQPARRFSASA